MGDLAGGINGPIAILGALYERERTGIGRFIDISLVDGVQGLLGYFAQLAFFTGKDPEPTGSQHQYLVPYGTFAASDGAIVVACLTPGFWGSICEAIERPELTADPRYDTLEKRRDARDEVNAMVTAFTSRHTVAELVTIFTGHEVPHAPILKLLEALDQPQARHREMVVEVEHAALGHDPHRQPRVQVRCADAAPRRAAGAGPAYRCGAGRGSRAGRGSHCGTAVARRGRVIQSPRRFGGGAIEGVNL